MKHFLLSLLLFIPLGILSQEVGEKEKTRHSLQLMGGMFFDALGYEYPGYSASLGYEIYFPNRFVFGVEVLTDQSPFVKYSSDLSSKDRWRRAGRLSGRINLGYHIIKRKHFDFSIMVSPHIDHRMQIIKTRDKETNQYLTITDNATFLFTPLIANRFEFFYKFNPRHAIGLNMDLNLDFETNVFTDILAAKAVFIGRLMLSYRVSLSGK
jgi:hypothetical protein